MRPSSGGGLIGCSPGRQKRSILETARRLALSFRSSLHDKDCRLEMPSNNRQSHKSESCGIKRTRTLLGEPAIGRIAHQICPDTLPGAIALVVLDPSLHECQGRAMTLGKAPHCQAISRRVVRRRLCLVGWYQHQRGAVAISTAETRPARHRSPWRDQNTPGPSTARR
jgi:hypothetical protein